MRLQNMRLDLLLLSLTSSISLVSAQTAAQAAELSAILADLNANTADYLGQITTGNSPPAGLLSLVQQVLTYTDDSYTTLYSQVDIAEVESYISGLPWYSTRLSAEIASATAALGGASSSSSSTAGSSSSTDLSSETTSSSSTAAASSSTSSSSSSSSSLSSSSTTEAPSSSSTEATSSSPATQSSNSTPGCSSVPNPDAIKDAELSAILADLNAHQADYIGQITAGNSPPAALLSLVQQVLTYTDDSYTTLYSSVDIDEVNSYITGLPWYSTRLSAEVASATESVADLTVCAAESSQASSSSSSSSSSAVSSSSTESPSSSAASSSTPESSSPASSTSEASCTVVADDDAVKDAELSAILADLNAHQSDYIGQITAGNSPPAGLLSLVQQVLTYTDDSYTTLYSAVDIGEVDSYITGLPWYSTRLSAAIASATAGVSGVTSCASNGGSSSTPTSTQESSSSSASSTNTPYFSGYLQDGQPHWDIHIPGSLGPWTEVSITGSKGTDSAYDFTSAEFTDGEASVDGDITLADSDFSGTYSESIDADSELVYSIDTEASGANPYAINAHVTITTADGKRARFLAKRATTDYDLSNTITDDATLSTSTSEAVTSTSGSATVSCSVVPDADAAKTAELSAILADLKANTADYLGQITAGNSPPAALLNLVQEALTYTDDSYTSLYSDVDIDQVNSYITGLPWYSSRLAGEIASATADLSGVTSCVTITGGSSATPSTTTAKGQSTTVVTITSCAADNCSSTKIVTGVTVVTTTIQGTITELTTYCPLTSTTESSSNVECTVIPGSGGDTKSAELSAILADLNANQADYLGQITAGNSPPAGLLSLVQQVLTYTDDSYTSLYSAVDLDEVNSYITGLPWYSSRLSAAIASATAGVGGADVTSCSTVGGSETKSSTTATPTTTTQTPSSTTTTTTPASSASEVCTVIKGGSGDTKATELSAILADLNANQAEYLGQITAGNSPPAALLSLVQQALTYTDDSYTSLYSDVDIDQVNSYITGLPWYSTRLSAAIASATAGAGGSDVTSCSVASTGSGAAAGVATNVGTGAGAGAAVGHQATTSTAAATTTSGSGSSGSGSNAAHVSTFEGSGSQITGAGWIIGLLSTLFVLLV